MQTPETIEQNTADPALSFNWPAQLIFKGTNTCELCCSSEPPIKAKMNIVGVFGINDVSSGMCSFNGPASKVPGLGELTLQVSSNVVALHISFFIGTTLIGTYTGDNDGIASGVMGGKCKFEFGTCQG